MSDSGDDISSGDDDDGGGNTNRGGSSSSRAEAHKLKAEARSKQVTKRRKKQVTEAFNIAWPKMRQGLSLIHISEPTRQAEISYAVFCLKKKK